ncbi:MAG TPA: hypothetical protein VFS87_02685 [Qipengyuania sp.]|nr:hypothetical protein [Qipengyuania sp.]
MVRLALPRSLRAKLLIAGFLPIALSGCVAAAIPLAAAGGLLAKSRIDRAEAPAAAAPVAQASATSDHKVTRLALTELPPPDAVAPAGNFAVAAFRDFALAELAKQPVTGKRTGALLSRASDLRTDRASCTAVSPAVFIDLDPGRGTFDPLAPGEPNRAMVSALDELRAKHVQVVWFSRLGASFEGATRAALAASGLDAAGTDRLVLLNNLDERKQSRRDEAAKLVCPIALLGDERADFDELYLYLKQPDAALALDAMIGRGWFLASPFTPAAETREVP